MRAGRPGFVLGLAGVGCAAGVCGAVAAALSCLPDLPPDSPQPAAEAGAEGGGFCGDGYIDLAAQEECDPGQQVGGDGGVCSSTCKVICAGLEWPTNDHCYQLLPAAEKALPTTAETLCDDLHGSHVATFASEEELAAAATYAHANILVANDFWVGLVSGAYGVGEYSSVFSEEPGWSPQCSGCYAETDNPAAPLHLPKDVEAGAGCVVATFLGTTTPPTLEPWDQHACTGAVGVHVLCEREPVGLHAHPCGAYVDGGVCIDLVATQGAKHYVYENNLGGGMTAAAARAECARLDGGLVVLQSRDEREQLWHELVHLDDPMPEQIWIGLATDDAGLWTWDDGTRVDAGYPSPWAMHEPFAEGGRAYMQPDPGAIDNTLAQSASDPTTPFAFVCEIRVPDGGP